MSISRQHWGVSASNTMEVDPRSEDKNQNSAADRAQKLQSEEWDDDQIPLGGDAFTNLETSKKRAREASGNMAVDTTSRQYYIDEQKARDEKKTRIVCFTQTAKDFITLTREFALELRKGHVERLSKYIHELQASNSGGEQGCLDMVTDLRKETNEMLETIRDPQKVEMVPHSLV